MKTWVHTLFLFVISMISYPRHVVQTCLWAASWEKLSTSACNSDRYRLSTWNKINKKTTKVVDLCYWKLCCSSSSGPCSPVDILDHPNPLLWISFGLCLSVLPGTQIWTLGLCTIGLIGSLTEPSLKAVYFYILLSPQSVKTLKNITNMQFLFLLKYLDIIRKFGNFLWNH